MKTTTKMQLVEIDKLIPYVNNARTHSTEQVNKIRSSLREFGFVNPIIIDKDYGVIAGHGRLLAAKEENMKEVPCVFVEHLTETQKKAYILADNRLALDAGWDEEILKLELENLKLENFDFEVTGFTLDEIDKDFGASAKDEKNPYTDVINVPQYEVTGDIPELSECVKEEKATELLAEIEKADITTEEREFLKKAATRHFAFDYRKVAEYYAGATKEMQRLMENSALVIIDFDNAMKNGFVRLTEALRVEAGLDQDIEDENA